YPLMLNLNGTMDNAQGRARVGELHLLLTVLEVPGATPQGGAGAALPDGRLSVLLGQLAAMTSPRSFTVVIDPALLDELDLMTRGYRVAATRGVQPPLTAPTGE